MNTILDISIQNHKKALIRVDFNVPIVDGVIKNNFRILQSLDTIKYCIENGLAVILMSHLGRPKNSKRDESLSLRPVANELSKLLNKDVKFSNCCIQDDSISTSEKLNPTEIHLLENLRFHDGEKDNDENFARKLSKHANIYINDAFGTTHRAHASNVGIVKFMEACYIGFLNIKELKYLSENLKSPIKPYSFLMGGVKVSDKIQLIENILNSADLICIGGAMAFTFIKAKGLNIGNSYFEESAIDLAGSIIYKAKQKEVELVLPLDVVVSEHIDKTKDVCIKDIDSLSAKDCGFDIGPKTSSLFEGKLKKSKTIVWNGPLGVAEKKIFSNGTNSIARFLNNLRDVSTVIGGGDTASCVYNVLPENNFSHISTGGGSSLELLSGNKLPAFEVLK